MKRDFFDRPFVPYCWIVCGERSGNVGDMSVGQVVACSEKNITVVKQLASKASHIRETDRVCIVPGDLIPEAVARDIAAKVAHFGYGVAPAATGGDA